LYSWCFIASSSVYVSGKRMEKGPCGPFSISAKRRILLQLEAVAVDALLLSGIGFMGADLNCIQAAVIVALAMVCAVVHGALDAGVGGAVAAAVNAFFVHRRIPPG
jgi:hypothetical protein